MYHPRSRVTTLRAPRVRALPCAFCPKRFFNFPNRRAIDHVLFGEPAFARDTDSEPQILKTLGAMSIRINHAFDAFLFGQRPPPPVEVEPLGRGVKFDP